MLDERSEPFELWDGHGDLAARPAVQSADVTDEIKRSLGIGVPRVRYTEPRPEVSGLAEGLGLK